MVQVAPELQILILNAVIIGVAYFGIYPSLRQRTLHRILTIDVALTGLAILVAGGWFWGTGAGFSLILFQVNWAVFTLVTLFVLEIPAVVWFARKYGIPLPYDGDDD